MPNKSYRLKLFESNRSNFRLSVLITFTRRNRVEGGEAESNLIYGSRTGSVTMNPGQMIEMTYLTDDWQNTKSVYLTYQYIPRIRSLFDAVIENAYKPDAFVTAAGGAKQINPAYSQPITIDNIGRKGSWVSVSLQGIVDDGGMVSSRPGVAVMMSVGAGSILTLDEAEAVDEILHEVNLTQMAMQACAAEIVLRGIGSEGQAQQQEAPAHQQYGNGGYPRQQGSYYSGGSRQAQPAAYQSAPRPAPTQPAAQPAPHPAYSAPRQATTLNINSLSNASAASARYSAPEESKSPAPREDTGMPLLNPDAIKTAGLETTVTDIDASDKTAIDDIFKDTDTIDEETLVGNGK
jgi:hypothetical protein